MELQKADLHAHTFHSDGLLSPSTLVAKARQCGLRALAITDHDCIDGMAEAVAAGEEHGVEVISGVELSVTVAEEEIHFLGYCFDPTNAGLCQYLSAYRQRRYERGVGMVERLQGLGVPLQLEAVLSVAGTGVLGRPHVARALVAEGHVGSYLEAFEQYLSDHSPAFVAKTKFPVADALALLHEAGGIGVLAHPGHWTSDAVLMALIRAGMDGIETIHPSHDAVLTHYYQKIAREFFLLQTGGSDYHGYREQDEENFGTYTIPYHQLDRLRRRSLA